MKRTALRRYTRINPVSKRRRSGQAGKLGIVRLYGADLETLRRRCFERDGNRCVDCGAEVAWDEEESARRRIPVGEMAHVRGKRNNGDTLGNVRVLCHRDHEQEHNGRRAA